MKFQFQVDASGLTAVILQIQNLARRQAIGEAATIVLSDIKRKTARGVSFDNEPFVGYIDARWKQMRAQAGKQISHVDLSFSNDMLLSIQLRGNVLAPSEAQMLKAVGNQENTRQPQRNRKFVGVGKDTLLKIEQRLEFLVNRTSAVPVH